jgi:hypothetical protein
MVECDYELWTECTQIPLDIVSSEGDKAAMLAFGTEEWRPAP